MKDHTFQHDHQMKVSGKVDHLHQKVKEKKTINTIIFDDKRVEDWMDEMVTPFEFGEWSIPCLYDIYVKVGYLEDEFYTDLGVNSNSWFTMKHYYDDECSRGALNKAYTMRRKGKTYIPWSKEVSDFLDKKEIEIKKIVEESIKPFQEKINDLRGKMLAELTPVAKELFVGSEIDVDYIRSQKRRMLENALQLKFGVNCIWKAYRKLDNDLLQEAQEIKEKNVDNALKDLRQELRDNWSSDTPPTIKAKNKPNSLTDESDFIANPSSGDGSILFAALVIIFILLAMILSSQG